MKGCCSLPVTGSRPMKVGLYDVYVHVTLWYGSPMEFYLSLVPYEDNLHKGVFLFNVRSVVRVNKNLRTALLTDR